MDESTLNFMEIGNGFVKVQSKATMNLPGIWDDFVLHPRRGERIQNSEIEYTQNDISQIQERTLEILIIIHNIAYATSMHKLDR